MSMQDDMAVRVEDVWKSFDHGRIEVLKGVSLNVTKGEIVALEANPEKYVELKRSDVLDGKVWSYPVLAYDHIYARSTKEGGCFDLK